jgi:hypothetical protein
MTDPDKYDKMRRGNIAPGIDAIYGIKSGKSEVQAYRFDAKKFTVKEAKKWLKDHDKHPIRFEPASGESDQEAFEATHQVKCYFNIPLAPDSKIEQTEDGATIVHDVPIMAEGRWVSMQGVDAMFTAECLEKSAGNWQDNGLWLRHPGGQPREVTNLIGAVINTRFDAKGAQGKAAQMGDLYIHCKTAESRSAAELVRLPEDRGGIKSISAETLLDLEYDKSAGQYTVVNAVYSGAALVRSGACEICKLPAYEQSGGTDMATKEKVKKNLEEEEEEGEETKDTPPAADAVTGPPQKDGKTTASLEGVMEALKNLAKVCEEGFKRHSAEPPPTGEPSKDEEEETTKVAYEALVKKVAELEAEKNKLSKKTLPATVASPTVNQTQTDPIEVSAHWSRNGKDLEIRR